MHQSFAYDDNRGFSLVEVLVCIVILIIVCIPLFGGFRTSSIFNNRAHHTQTVTAYAQEVVEDMKRLSVKAFTEEIKKAKDKDGNDSGGVITGPADPELLAKFTGYSTELFEVITCTQKGIEIGGKTYDMEAIYDPTPYSTYSAGTMDSVADANVLAVADVSNIDGFKFPVIADELSRYEGTGDSSATFLNDLQMMDKANGGTKTLNELYAGTSKTIDIIIKDDGSSAIKVIADVIYESEGTGGTTLKKTYNVYNSRFALQEIKDGDGKFVSYSAGGKIYIFARAYQDQSGSMDATMIHNNTIRIINHHAVEPDNQPLEVYLVRGYYSGTPASNPDLLNKKGVNFDHVQLSDGSASKSYSTLAPGEELVGEWISTNITSTEGFSNMNFYTNIKGKNLTRVLTAEDIEQTIGKDVSKLRCYQLTVTLTDITDPSNKKIVAHVVSTKEV